MVYELWDLISCNMIDWFEDQSEAVGSVQAHVAADEANNIMLLVHDHSDDAADAKSRADTGGDLVAWLNAAPAELRRAS